MPHIGIGVDLWSASSSVARTTLPPGQAYLFARGQATVSFVGAGSLVRDFTATGREAREHLDGAATQVNMTP